MASATSGIIPLIRVQVGCRLKKEKSQQQGEAQRRQTPHTAPEHTSICLRISAHHRCPHLNHGFYTCKTSPSRATTSYKTGLTKKPRSKREISPATTTIAKGFCVSLPTPVERAAGSKPRQATSAVIMIGRRRNSEASSVASRMVRPSRRNLLM